MVGPDASVVGENWAVQMKYAQNFFSLSLTPTELDENKEAQGCEGVMSKRWVLTDSPTLDWGDAHNPLANLEALGIGNTLGVRFKFLP